MSSTHTRRGSGGNTLDAVGTAADDVAGKVLAEDAEWKIIQKNCFTRWTNEHLKVVNKHIADLETDFSDGLRLIALVEVLSHKEITQKYTRRPTFRSQKLENITLALKFLERDEGIRIVNIGKLQFMLSFSRYKG
jgi:Calponin homology (CH) domain